MDMTKITHRHIFTRRLLATLLTLAHVALVTPLPDAYAMESVNFKVNQYSVSSGGGTNSGAITEIQYSSIAEPVVGNVESPGYKIAFGYINTIVSNPPVFKGVIPDANMRFVWNRGESYPTAIPLDTYFSSPDNSPLTYIVEGDDNNLVNIDSATHVASFSSQGKPDYCGSEVIRFVAIDQKNGNRTKSNYIALAVRALSGNSPIIYPINDITVNENELIQVNPVIFDPDGDPLTVTFTTPLNDSGKWQTTYNDAGQYKVTTTVSDGVLRASVAFNITVNNVNRPPIIDSISDITVNEGDIVKLNVNAYDPDGDNVTVSYPTPFGSDGNWQTGYNDAGTHHFTITASDGDLNATSDVNVIVNNVNAPPSVQLYVSRYNILPNEDLTLYVLAQDPDNNTLKLTVKKDGVAIPGCENITLNNQTFSKNISISAAGSHTIEATVQEDGVSGTPNTATASMSINVDENSSIDGYFPIWGDFNGDGLTDLGYYNRSLGIWKVMLAKPDGTFGPMEYWINTSNDFGNNDQWFYPMTGDFNGDGKTDIGFMRVPTSDGASSYIKIATSTGRNFSIKSGNWRTSDDGSLQSDWHNALCIGDYNGDGFSDAGQMRVDNKTLCVGLTLDNLGIGASTQWSNGGSLSISDFSPIAADFNGDGLTDLCLFKKSSGEWAVMLSKGGQIGVPGNLFTDPADWMTSFGSDKDPIIGDFSCDGLIDIGYMEKESSQWSIKYALSDGTKFNLNSGQPYTYQTGIPDSVTGTFITGDFNGDGLFDVAFFDKNTHEWTVKLHHSKFPDMMVEIDNGIGGKTSVTYKDSVMFENNNTVGLPTLPFSIRVVSQVTQTDGLGSVYNTSYFYRDGVFEPEKREFRGFGYVKVIDVGGNYKETYFNQDDIYKGRPLKEVVRDRYDKIYAETLYNWQDRKLFSNTVDYAYLADKISTAYDPATGEHKSSQMLYTYDNYGNVTDVKEEGFLGLNGDERFAHIIYYYDTTNWILSKPLESQVKDAYGVIVAATTYVYSLDGKGSLEKEVKWLGQIGNAPSWSNNDNPTTEFKYDPCGNVLEVKDGLGNITTTEYDPTNTFPLTVTNALGHVQTFTYNKATGKIVTSTDSNGQVAVSEYDGFGRQTRVLGPGGISEELYAYDLTTQPAKIISTTKIAEGKYAKAFTFVDGLGRQILSRTEAEYKGTSKHIVSGEVKYDSRGQVIRKYLPYYIDIPIPDGSYIQPQNSTLFIRYEYDAMGRAVKAIRPDNKASYTIYGVNTVEAINENGQHTRQTSDAYGRIIEVEENNGSVANYIYDTLGNLTDTYDAASPRNHVQMQYDTLGRKISMIDPDMGGFAGKSWQYHYDKIGNLTSQVDAKGQTISFQYDKINRLIFKSTGVTYTYDGSTQDNLVGRLSQVADSSGTTKFFYDILGREIKTTKTITTSSYTIERTFDSVDRLVTVKYPDPDNSVVTYTYNKQGGISSLRGTVGAEAISFVSSVDYDANGQIERINYGNGTHTDYAYDPYTFRLDGLKTLSPQNAVIQNLSYNFDPIGNVTSILDSVYSNTQHFQYDNLNRITLATGASYGSIEYQYNSIGNLLKKGNLTMEYGQSAGPHAVTTLRRPSSLRGSPEGATEAISITYDSNGNMTQKGDTSFEYDIENQLKKVATPKGGGSFDISLNFTPGWNFFSLPGFIPNTSGNIKDILSSVEGKYDEVLTYDTCEGKWKHYVGNTKFNQFDKFEYGKGYLIYIKEPCTLNLTGSFPATAQIGSLKSGWNLICAPTDSEIDTAKAFKGISYDAIASLRSAEGGEAIYDYNPPTLQKGKACWVHVITDQTWNIPLSEVETRYTYDGDGGRVARIADKEMTVYIGSAYELEGISGQTPDKTTKHIFMGSTRICSIETTTSVHVYYYHTDHIGSSNVITDESGAVVNVLEYSPFGEVSTNTGDYSTDKRFTGKIYDESSALCYFGARYYDPELARFITADPTVAHPFDPQDFNRYSYCRNNPVIYIDPTGLSWWSKFWNWITGGVGAIIAAVAIIAITAVANVFTGGALTPILMGEIFGAIGGAAGAAATGGDIGRGMLIGTIVGGITGGVLGGAGGGGSTAIGQTSTSAINYGTTDVALYAISGISAEVSTQTAAAGISAMQAIITSGVGAGSAVINGMVSTAYAAETSSTSNSSQTTTAPKSWGPKWMENRIPNYGNYGGPDNTDSTYRKKPIDQMDNYFRLHDMAWDAGCANAADRALNVQLSQLSQDPGKWRPPAPDRNYAIKYRNWAEEYFRLRSKYLEITGR